MSAAVHLYACGPHAKKRPPGTDVAVLGTCLEGCVNGCEGIASACKAISAINVGATPSLAFTPVLHYGIHLHAFIPVPSAAQAL